MTRELEGLEEVLKAEIHIALLKVTYKNIKLKNPRHKVNHGFWFKEFISIQMIISSTRIRMDDQRKDHIDPKRPKQMNHPQKTTDP